MNIFIITGTSKGIGKAIVKKLLLNKENYIFGLSRSYVENTYNFYNLEFDLSNPDMDVIEKLWSKINNLNFEKIYLINNAAVIEPIKKIGNCKKEEIENNIYVNLTAPFVLVNSFLNFFKNHNVKKFVINISSGSAYTPFSGWSAYCSSKAGLNMFTKTLALEADKNLKVISIAPGIVDTHMQEQIRKSNINDFELVETFKDLKEKGMLYSSDFSANKIIDIIFNDQIKNGSILDISDY
jgi:benzil reductase ((S)-benzoin forming)